MRNIWIKFIDRKHMQKVAEVNVKKHQIFFKINFTMLHRILATTLKLLSENLSATTKTLLFLDVK